MIKLFQLFTPFILWIFLFPIYKDRVPAFGCFDDCFNFMGGYFVNSGKHLYGEIFYNHQPVLAYLSAFIQKIGTPESIYSLVWQHRLFVIAWSIIWNIFFAFRFGWIGVGFSILYETTKGFLFGERFLAEALIVYPIVYLVGLVGKKISRNERILAAVLVWFVVFSREPYIPLVLLLLFIVKPNISVFFGLSLVTLFTHPLKDYFFNVVTVNTILATSGNIFRSFAYPALIFFGGNWNVFRWVEVGIAVLFWLSIRKKQFFPFIILGLANIRPVSPGTIYYEAFHHLVFYAVFLFITLLNIRKVLWFGFWALVVFALIHPKSYLYDRVDRNSEFTQNYSIYYVTGSVVRMLSQQSDTLFLDGIDDLIYWEAKRYSQYPFSWYTSVMHEFPLYTDARIKMFAENPPDFYYGKCSDDRLESVLPNDVLNDYLRFYWQKRATCLYVRKQMYAQIPKDRLEAVERQFEYSVR